VWQMKNIFIVVDGMDGSGKTELIKHLHNHLFSKDKRFKILTTREPSNGPFGQKIRKLLLEDKDPQENADELLGLFVKDREDHLKRTIMPFLSEEGDGCNIVLCDRYYYSTLAFQQTQGLPFDRIFAMNRDFQKPDIAFILDVDPKSALKRISGRVKEKFENLAFMERLRKEFLLMKDQLGDNIVVIDANKTAAKVFEEVRKKVDGLF
jgi:dTMP kinase